MYFFFTPELLLITVAKISPQRGKIAPPSAIYSMTIYCYMLPEPANQTTE